MNINLLPRKSRIQKIFWPVILSVIVIYICITLLLVFTASSNSTSIDEKNEETVKLQTEINNLRMIRQPDIVAEDYNDYLSDINALKEFRRDWIQILQQVSISLPPTSRILSFNVNDSGELIMESQFADLQQVAEYVAVLGGSDHIESVIVSNILRVNYSQNSITNNSNDNLVDPTGTTSDLIDQKDNLIENHTQGDFISNLEETIEPPQDESERILNELRWLMEQRAARDEHGILVPNMEMQDVPNFENWTDSGLFTTEEIESALNELDQYKQLTDIPTSAPTVIIPVEKEIFVYQSIITIKIVDRDLDKEVAP